ncbi:hypothetical protein [uncultured Tolumonas sp.]|uniref:hypothetical protein n=1 Tax=uncultured Tolumonas sp. TaxID=263765 RepID=UPI002A0A6978|nr:hypothetical protein [uncultured Tolumonas sp.]
MNDHGRVDFVEMVARRKLNQPEEWELCGWERIGDSNDLIVEGGIPRPLKSGPRKGARTWRDSKISKVCVTDAEEIQEKLNYEKETGKCCKCAGTGSMWYEWHHIDGNKYKACNRCSATGVAPKQSEAA